MRLFAEQKEKEPAALLVQEKEKLGAWVAQLETLSKDLQNQVDQKGAGVVSTDWISSMREQLSLRARVATCYDSNDHADEVCSNRSDLLSKLRDLLDKKYNRELVAPYREQITNIVKHLKAFNAEAYPLLAESRPDLFS